MLKNSKIWIFLAAAIGLVTMFLVFFGKPRVDWSETFVLNKEKAKGTYFITELLKKYNEGSDFDILDAPIHITLENVKDKSNYVFIGEDIYLVEEDAQTLLDFVDDGNDAFIFTKNIPYELIGALSSYEVDYYYESRTANGAVFGLEHSQLKMVSDSSFHYNIFGRSGGNWSFISRDSLTVLNAEELGHVKLTSVNQSYHYIDSTETYETEITDTLCNGVNYFRVKHGQGYFYFHTQPGLFVNAYLIENDNLDYVDGVFAHLNNGDILWEEHNWIFNRPYLKLYVPRTNFYRNDESILSMILENQELKWGWYGLLIMAILFVIFNGKRKQATIPIIEDRSNRTLIQIKKLGYLYKDSTEYFEITQNMFENFLWYLHVKLNIDTHQGTDKIIRDIVKITKYDEDEIRSIFTRYQKIENWKSVTHGVFIQLHDDIEKFYRNLK